MNKPWKPLLASLLLTIMTLTGCGGGGGASGTGSTGSQTFTGTVTGFGSVFVNGIEFDTSGTSISIDGSSSSENALKVGMVVTVTGTASGTTGTATSITSKDELEGIVLSNNITTGQSTGTMDVMGQTVTVTDMTEFESSVSGVTTFSEITAGMIVEVNGYSSGTGTVTATRIEVKAMDLATYLSSHPNGVEVKGKIANLDTTAMTFMIGNMTVDYSGATLEGFSNGLQDTLYVEVKSIAGIVNGNLVASKVELEDGGKKGHTGSENEETEIKGAITADFNVDRFEINGQVVIVTSTTKLEHITLAQLVTGTIVEVEGYFNTTGELVAKKIEAKYSHQQLIKGTVSSITTTGTNEGTIMVNSNTIMIDNNTMMKDVRNDVAPPDHRFNLSALAVGDYIRVFVYTDAQGNLIATKLKRYNAPASTTP